MTTPICSPRIVILAMLLTLPVITRAASAATESAKERSDTQALADYERTQREAAATGAKKETNAVAMALEQCEEAANDAEVTLSKIPASTNPATQEACNGVRLVISAIRGLSGVQAKWPMTKPPTADMTGALAFYLACAKTGKDPFAGMVSGVRPYKSPIDGDILGYEFKLPRNYSPTQKYPLEIELHCSGGFMWRGLMAGLIPSADLASCSEARHRGKFDSSDPAQTNRPCIWVHILGRGEASFYTSLGEAAIIEAIADIHQHYAVDDARILIGGASMGGSGSFRLCTLYPDLFPIGYSLTGGGAYGGCADNGMYNAYWRPENLCNNSFLIWDSPNDSHFKDNHAFSERLTALAATNAGCYAHLELQDPKGSHGDIDQQLRNEGWGWLRQQVRNPWPKHVVYKSYGLRYNSAYWVHLDQMQDAEKPARIEADVQSDGKLRVITSNLDRFHLDLAVELVGASKEVGLTIDDQALRTAAGKTVSFSCEGGKWIISTLRVPSGLVKEPGVSGPILDVFMGEPVLFVYGTGQEKDPVPRDKMVDTVVNTLFGKPDGGICFHAAFPRKADVDVTAADMASHHLVLLGTPAQNALVARIATNLPVQFSADGIKLGAKEYKGAGLIMVYPNPLHPEHYVLLMPENYARADPDPRSFHDYFIGTFGPGTHALTAGTFDTHWQLKP